MSTVIYETDKTILVVGGMQGPPGTPGVPGPAGGAATQVMAGAVLGGNRAVVTDSLGRAIYADSGTLAHADKIVGITLNAAAANEPVNVQGFGLIEEPSWAWDTGVPIYLGANGTLTQTLPTAGFIIVLGTAKSSSSMFVRIGQPIILGV